MSSPVITDGDTLTFVKTFGERMVQPTVPEAQQTLSASGQARIAGKKVCVAGDEKKVRIKATYKSPSYPTEGTGTITISALAGDQLALSSGATERLIVKGSQFIALFTPETPAQNPQTGPDPNAAPTPGTGTIKNQQAFVYAK